ncbi:MAG: ABC transporter ATP-binding protein, partial [Verrucomicrobiota bacterium]
MSLLEVRNLKTYFPVHSSVLRRHIDDIKAVDDVSFSIEAGTTVGLVGESGSGKSTIGKTLLKLIPATSGQVLFDGVDILPMKESAFRPLRRQM